MVVLQRIKFLNERLLERTKDENSLSFHAPASLASVTRGGNCQRVKPSNIITTSYKLAAAWGLMPAYVCLPRQNISVFIEHGSTDKG